MASRQQLIESTLAEIRRQHRSLDERSREIGREIKNQIIREGKALAILALQGSINQLKGCSPDQFTDKAALAVAVETLEEIQEHIAI